MIDFNPVTIEYFVDKKSYKWIHPFIDKVCDFKPSEWNPDYKPDYNVFRVYLETDNGTVYIIFKSDFFMNRESESISETLMNQKYDLSDEEWDNFLDIIAEVLTGDIWMPAPPYKGIIKNSRDWIRCEKRIMILEQNNFVIPNSTKVLVILSERGSILVSYPPMYLWRKIRMATILGRVNRDLGE